MGFDDAGEQLAERVGKGGAAATGGAPPPELHSGQDMLAWKREYNIRQREADWKRRQEELLTKKQIAWQIQSCERENRLTSARESRRREKLEKQVYHRHLDVDRKYKERCRNVEIERREKTWEEQENERLVLMHREAQEKAKERDAVLTQKKAEKCDELRSGAHDRAERRRQQEEMEAKREANIKKKAAERQAKAAAHAHKLKQDEVAKSNEIVNNFMERIVPAEPTQVSEITRRNVDSQGSH